MENEGGASNRVRTTRPSCSLKLRAVCDLAAMDCRGILDEGEPEDWRYWTEIRAEGVWVPDCRHRGVDKRGGGDQNVAG